MEKTFDYTEIETAILESPNDKAPRLNSIPTELYKTLHKKFTRNHKENNPGFNVTRLLLKAYNDIESSGVAKAELLEGWLCPIYKKKD